MTRTNLRVSLDEPSPSAGLRIQCIMTYCGRPRRKQWRGLRTDVQRRRVPLELMPRVTWHGDGQSLKSTHSAFGSLSTDKHSPSCIQLFFKPHAAHPLIASRILLICEIFYNFELAVINQRERVFFLPKRHARTAIRYIWGHEMNPQQHKQSIIQVANDAAAATTRSCKR